MTLFEEKELEMIKGGLSFNEDNGRWIANRHVAYATLTSTEKRLMKNELPAEIYKRQIDDMIERRVAREVSEFELNQHQGQNSTFHTMIS